MFDTITALSVIHEMGTGRTRPTLVMCERDDGSTLDAIVKCSSKTMQGVHDLAVEALCGMLAHDLSLPVPEFFAVEITQDFIDTVQSHNTREILELSDSIAFGSLQLPSGYAVWGRDQEVPKSLCEAAAEIYAFDAVIVNGDKRPDNPNCLFSGSQLAIIDHELCFTHELFWKAPWMTDGFSTRRSPNDHIFAKPRLAQCPSNLDRFRSAWAKKDDVRVTSYFRALPPSWNLPASEEDRIRGIILDSRDHIDEVVRQALEALR